MTTGYRPRLAYDEDEARSINAAYERIMLRRLDVGNGKCLVTVRILARNIADDVGVEYNARLTQHVHKLLSDDPKVKFWGFGASRCWDKHRLKKYASTASQVFSVNREGVTH